MTKRGRSGGGAVARGFCFEPFRYMHAVSIFAALLIGGAAEAGQVISGPTSALDGDSLKVGGQEVRLHGIDAPEWEQLCKRDGQRYPCGQVAARALADRIDGRDLECDVQDVDRYGRAVAVCFLEGEDLNAWLV